MIAVVVAAVLVEAAHQAERHCRLRSVFLIERAKAHHHRELYYSLLAGLIGRCGTADDLDELLTIELTPAGASVRPKSVEAERILNLRRADLAVKKRQFAELSACHARCALRLERAARRPWLSVSLGPPPVPEAAAEL
jgi:hypothetical protein